MRRRGNPDEVREEPFVEAVKQQQPRAVAAMPHRDSSSSFCCLYGLIMLLVVVALLVFAYMELLEEKKYHQECRKKLETLYGKLDYSAIHKNMDKIFQEKIKTNDNDLQIQLNQCTSQLGQIRQSYQVITVEEGKGEKCEGVLCTVFISVYDSIGEALSLK